MATENQNFEIYAGEDVSLPFTLSGVDLTGKSTAFYVRHRHTNRLALTLTSGDGTIVYVSPAAVGGATGTLEFSSEATGLLEFDEYDVSMKRTDEGFREVYLTGIMKVKVDASIGRPHLGYYRR